MKNLKFILMPHYWMMNYPFSKVWDAKLNKLLQTHKFTNRTEYTADLGNVTIWIVNHPYASFTSSNRRCRPSRQTIFEAKRKLERECPKLDPYYL